MRFLLLLTAVACLAAEAPVETKGLPPRASASDYEVQGRAGAVTVAGEFKGHAVPTAQGTFASEDYIVVEAALFGPPGTRVVLSTGDFSLRLAGRKAPFPSQHYGVVLASLTDPEWSPPEPPASKSKGGVSAGGGGGGTELGQPPPPPPKMPMDLRHAMNVKVQKAVLPEGDRTLPQAGLLFFPYRGKTQSLRSVELIYTGPSGQAVLRLQ